MLAANSGSVSNFTFAFLVTILQLAGLIAAVSGVQIVNRILLEETNFRVEPLLAGALRRRTYLTSNLVVAYLAPAVSLLVAGTVIGLITSNADIGVSIPNVIGLPCAWPAGWQ